MAIAHAQSGQPVDVSPLGPRLQAEKTVALFKSDQLEVIRLVLQAGKALPPHKVSGEITIHCLEGRIAVGADGTQHMLGAGQLLYLDGGVLHDVKALEDASALVTIVLHAAPSSRQS
jgi:quercetin dioxygenase-like cupin family protein